MQSSSLSKPLTHNGTQNANPPKKKYNEQQQQDHLKILDKYYLINEYKRSVVSLHLKHFLVPSTIILLIVHLRL